MATFRSFDGLRDALADADFDRPPAIVCNAHVTGLSVARALKAHNVPVIAIDRNERGVAPYSEAVDFAGRVTYPLDDEEGFRKDVEALAAATGYQPVAFGCMDEWVHAFSRTEPDGVRLPFADREVVDRVLDKELLYDVAEALGVPYPETYRIAETDPDGAARDSVPAAKAADRLGFPLVVKPALKRQFEEAVGTNVIEVADEAEFEDVVANASDECIRIMAQEKVPVVQGEDCSLASYVPESGDPISFVGNARVRYPLGYGTSCVVQRATGSAAREVEENALAVLDETGYYGISEAEFVYDGDREEYVLLDVNTRPWKWISLPVQAGANLPLAAYSDAIGEDSEAQRASENRAAEPRGYEADEIRDARWVYLADYLKALGTDGFTDVLGREDWLSLMSGEFGTSADLTTGVYRPSDPDPAYQLLNTEFGAQEYYCSC